MRERMFKPGQSGNPKGRQKGRTLEEEVRKLLDAKLSTGADAPTRLEALAAILLEEVMQKRNTALIRATLDRLWPAGLDVNLHATHEIAASEEEIIEALSQLPDKEFAALQRIQAKVAETVAERRKGQDDGGGD